MRYWSRLGSSLDRRPRSRRDRRRSTLGEGSVAGGEYLREHGRRAGSTRPDACNGSRSATARRRWPKSASIGKSTSISKGAGRARAEPMPRPQRQRALGCGDCDCSARLEARLASRGAPFFATLKPPICAPSAESLAPSLEPTCVYTPAVPSSSLQALLARAGAALERGRGPEAAQLLAPALRSAGLHARRRARRPLGARRGVAAAGRPRPGGDGAGPHAGYLPRHDFGRATVDAVATARPPRVGARRSVARDRAARPRAEARGNRPRLARHRPRPLRARRSAIARSATSRSCASTSPRRRRRCSPPAIAGTWRSCTRCRASRSRSSVDTTRR